MENSTPKTMSIEEFNDRVKSWTITRRSRMVANAPKESGDLSQSVSYNFRKNFGHISTIGYKFLRRGVFVHYGVGRGYIRQGNTVVRGSRNKDAKIDLSTGFNRKANDWFDVEIRTGLRELADIARDFYGDMAMYKLLEKIDRFVIQKK